MKTAGRFINSGQTQHTDPTLSLVQPGLILHEDITLPSKNLSVYVGILLRKCSQRGFFLLYIEVVFTYAGSVHRKEL